MRSRKVSPGSAVTRTTSRSLTRLVPPVTELRMSVPGSLRTGADSPVIAASLTNPTPSIDVAVAGDRLARLDDDDVALAELGRADVLERPVGPAPMGGRLGARLAQGRGLGATAGLGDGLGVGGEQDREPEPDRDLDLEAETAGRGSTRWTPVTSGDRDDRHERRP